MFVILFLSFYFQFSSPKPPIKRFRVASFSFLFVILFLSFLFFATKTSTKSFRVASFSFLFVKAFWFKHVMVVWVGRACHWNNIILEDIPGFPYGHSKYILFWKSNYKMQLLFSCNCNKQKIWNELLNISI